MKRLPATCAIQALQGGGGGVAAALASGQMLVAVANPIQNPPLANVPVGDDDDAEVILFYYSNKAVLEKQNVSEYSETFSFLSLCFYQLDST